MLSCRPYGPHIKRRANRVVMCCFWTVFPLLALLGGDCMAQALSVSAPAYTSTGTYSIYWNGYMGHLEESKGDNFWTKLSGAEQTDTPYSYKTTVTRPNGTYYYRAYGCQYVYSGGSYRVECSYSPIDKTVVDIPPATPTISGPASDTTGTHTLTASKPTYTTKYEWKKRINSGTWGTISGATGQELKIDNGVTAVHDYQVRACSATACSGWSSVKSVTVVRKPGIPPRVYQPMNPSAGTHIVRWDSSSGSVTKYTLQYKPSTVTSYSTAFNAYGFSSTFEDLAPGLWQYRVQACKTYNSVTACSSWRNGEGSVIDADGLEVFEYDEFGRVKAVHRGKSASYYEYDKADNRKEKRVENL
jgi:hypothetical protein